MSFLSFCTPCCCPLVRAPEICIAYFAPIGCEDGLAGRRPLQKRKKVVAPSSVSAASVQAEDVAELARAVCRVALLVESSQDFISISHILWVITRGSATAAEHRSAGVRGASAVSV